MMQRLFEGEDRAASITESAPSPRLSTQASNFSFFSRSAAFAVTTTVSMPNWRKPSASSAREGSSKPTSAVRAAAFRVRAGAKVVVKALSIGEGKDSTFNTIVEAVAIVEKAQRVNGRSTKVSLLFSRMRERGHYEVKLP